MLNKIFYKKFLEKKKNCYMHCAVLKIYNYNNLNNIKLITLKLVQYLINNANKIVKHERHLLSSNSPNTYEWLAISTIF